VAALNVALYHHQPGGGGAMRVLTEYVRRAAHDFALYTPMPEEPGIMTLDPRVAVRRFPRWVPRNEIGRIVGLLALPRRGRALAATIDAGGHDVAFVHLSHAVQAPEILPFLRTPSLYYAPEALRAAHEPEPEFGRPRGLKPALTRAGLNPYEVLRARLDMRDIRGATQVVTHSRFTAGELKRVYGVDAQVVPLGVDAQTFTPAEVPRERSVLAVGALHPLKGHQLVIDAVARMPDRPRLVLVGDRGHLEGALRAHAERQGVELELHQGVSGAELVALYRRAGVLACGQIREPFGLTPLEAMATGTPVVAVAEGGYLETVRDGETGLLVPRDADAMAAALERVLRDPVLAGRLGAAGRTVVERDWTWERTAAGYDALLEALCTSG
jgi:glycosyltransferase involved in cell wall biosynthesis